MKRILLALAAMTISASAAAAYVQPGHLSQAPSQAIKSPALRPGNNLGMTVGGGTVSPMPHRDANCPQPGDRHYGDDRDDDEGQPGGATNPVPEPGTMMLASMGLLALGAAVRRRRR